jgi:hypothetical protein
MFSGLSIVVISKVNIGIVVDSLQTNNITIIVIFIVQGSCIIKNFTSVTLKGVCVTKLITAVIKSELH